MLGSPKSAKRFVRKIIEIYDAIPLDNPSADFEGIKDEIRTPLDLLTYVQNNRGYTESLLAAEYKDVMFRESQTELAI